MKHNYAGNCWEHIQSEAEDKKCLEHDNPRGNCSQCPRCSACNKMFAGSKEARQRAKPVREAQMADIEMKRNALRVLVEQAESFMEDYDMFPASVVIVVTCVPLGGGEGITSVSAAIHSAIQMTESEAFRDANRAISKRLENS